MKIPHALKKAQESLTEFPAHIARVQGRRVNAEGWSSVYRPAAFISFHDFVFSSAEPNGGRRSLSGTSAMSRGFADF